MLLGPLGVTRELMLRVGDDEEEGKEEEDKEEVRKRSSRVVVHSTAEMMREMGISLSDLAGSAEAAKAAGGGTPQQAATAAANVNSTATSTSSAIAAKERDTGKDPFAASSGELDWERFQGPQQLAMPGTFNSKRMLRRGLPGCATLGSARALAKFYAALGGGQLVTKPMLRLSLIHI